MPPAQLPLGALLQPDHVRVPLTARTLADGVLQLVAALAATGAVRDADRLRERVEEARAEDLVGLGDRAFILHYRDESIRELVIALGLSAEPLRRALDDAESQAARIVAVVVAPPRLVARHLQVVRTLTRSLSRPAVVDAVLAADTPAAVCAAAAFQVTVPAQLTVRDLMTERPRTVSPDTSLRSAVLDMRRAGVGGLPVVDAGNRVLGMLSERELLRDLLSHYLPRAGGGAPYGAPAMPATRRTVRDVMTRQVLCVAPDQPLAEVAALLLNKDVDRVPVVQEDRLVGFLTRGDIVRTLIGT